MLTSTRLGLPFLSAGQAQKELTQNEALLLLDAAVQTCCAAAPANAPPQSPEIGFAYLCGNNPTGAWQGRPNSVACHTENGWRFIEPFDGFELFDRDSGRTWRFASGAWSLGIAKASEIQVNGIKVLGAQQPSISNATGGTMVDTQARNTLEQVLSALRAHGIIAQQG